LGRLANKWRMCEKEEHIPSGEFAHWTIFRGNVTFYGLCRRCGSFYEKNPSADEYRRYREAMETPMNI